MLIDPLMADSPQSPPPEILVSRKSAYSREMYAPECDVSRLFCELAGSKNLTMDQLRIIRKLGFKVTLAQLEIKGLD